MKSNWEDNVFFGKRELRGVQRVASVGCFAPRWDLKGDDINFGKSPGIVALTVIPLEQSTLVSWACLKEHVKTLESLLQGLEKTREDCFIKGLIGLMLGSFCENTFLSPHFWDRLPEDARTSILRFCDPHETDFAGDGQEMGLGKKIAKW